MRFVVAAVLCLSVAVAVQAATYTNSRYEISFEYPTEWTLKEPQVFSSQSIMIETDGRQIAVGHHEFTVPESMSIREFGNLYHEISIAAPATNITNKYERTIAGVTAYVIEAVSPVTPYSVAHFRFGEMGWYVWANSKHHECPTFLAFEQILNTFQFNHAASPMHPTDGRVFGAVYQSMDFLSVPGVKQYLAFRDGTSVAPAKTSSFTTQATCTECCGGGCNFGSKGSAFWCSCCQQNCGGNYGACVQQGYGSSYCTGGGGGSGMGSFGNPKNAYIWCGSGYHTGSANWACDVQGGLGDYISSVQSGTVTESRWDTTGYGNIVIVNHGSDIYAAYAHLNDRGVSAGQGVSKGTRIGGMGNTGTVAVHLHFHLRNGGYGALNPNGMPGFRSYSWPSAGSWQGGANCAAFQ